MADSYVLTDQGLWVLIKHDISDGDAIHDNVASEISAVTEKTTPVDNDLLLIEDSAASNAKKSLKIGNLPAGGISYVNRGSWTPNDWTSNDFTKGSWTDLDCSSIVDSGTSLILLHLMIRDDTIGSHSIWRRNGATESWTDVVWHRILIANFDHHHTFFVPCDSNAVIEYYFTNKSWGSITCNIIGWFA